MEIQSASQLIKLSRKRKGLTQQQLADQAGVSLRTVQLTFLVNPLFGLLVPAIMGYTKQNKDPLYSKHLKRIIVIQAVGLFFLGSFIGYIIIADFFKIVLPSFLSDIFNSAYFLLIPVCYYIVILTFTISNYIAIRKAKLSSAN
jgi:hypothetical protein